MTEITLDLGLSREAQAQVNLHSFLNVMNILMGELQLFRLDLGRPDALPESLALASEALTAVRAGRISESLAERLSAAGDVFVREAEAARAGAPPDAHVLIDEIISNVGSILDVVSVRVAEYASWVDGGLAWRAHSVPELRARLAQFFDAVEKNAKGRYHIVRNIAAQESNDYLVTLDVDSDEGDVLTMPPILHDVFRDLLANARKYTAPGGRISGGLAKSPTSLVLVVEDDGIGIPSDEIEKVVTLGYRASNVQSQPTRGAGFGLTKAYAATRELGGRFFIGSEQGRGTRIRIEIPVPA